MKTGKNRSVLTVSNNSYDYLFKDYYFNNKGIFFKSFEIKINNLHSIYDVYWGDPSIIFSDKALKETFPLAVTNIPRKKIVQNPRIFLHEKLEQKYNKAFEMVVAHEIGHIWLYDVVGINHPMKNNFMEELETEIWADYFAYSYFVKYRNINCLEGFNEILEKTGNLQMQIYSLDPEQHMEYVYFKKVANLKELENKVKMALENRNSIMIQMIKAIEITLNSLGDVFK